MRCARAINIGAMPTFLGFCDLMIINIRVVTIYNIEHTFLIILSGLLEGESPQPFASLKF